MNLLRRSRKATIRNCPVHSTHGIAMLTPPPADTCIAYLIRHGATESNLADPPILQGRSINGPLSPRGQRQADQAAQCLSGHPLRAVYSSPLRRAQETAERVASVHRLRVLTLADITEVDVGAWESAAGSRSRRRNRSCTNDSSEIRQPTGIVREKT